MKALLSVVLCLLIIVDLHSQDKKVFPTINGTNLNGQPISLPLLNDRYTVLAIAFSRGAEDALRRWLNPLYETFVKREINTSGLSPAEINDVNFYFIPLISGLKKISDDFKKGTDKEYWQYIVDTEKTDIKELEKKLAINDDNIPYFFVLDKTGRIVERQSGTYQSPKLDKLEDAIE